MIFDLVQVSIFDFDCLKIMVFILIKTDDVFGFDDTDDVFGFDSDFALVLMRHVTFMSILKLVM
jgi:hypothetical protein